ncbi:MAG: DUF4199 domain-containing protein [Leadbetterella sp.]
MEKVSTARIALKWGLILGAISIVLSTLLFISDLWETSILGVLACGGTISFGLYFALKEFKNLNQNKLAFNQIMGLGLLMSLTWGLVLNSFDMVYSNFIDPTITERRIEINAIHMQENGESKAKIEEKTVFWKRMYSSGQYFFYLVLLTVLLSFIFILVFALIMRTDGKSNVLKI